MSPSYTGVDLFDGTTMVQGSSAKLSKKAKSVASTKKKVQRTKSHLTKGRKEFRANPNNYTNSQHAAAAEDLATTKAIVRRNEASAAAKAVSVGTQFFLSDVASTGKSVMQQKLKARDKKQVKNSHVGATERIKGQLRKLGRNV